MKFTPSSTARCRTRLTCPRSLGLPHDESPQRRIAPKPNRLILKSPRSIVPASAAPLQRDRFMRARSFRIDRVKVTVYTTGCFECDLVGTDPAYPHRHRRQLPL